MKFSLKKTSATKHSPPSNVNHMEFYRNFLFEYSLIGIVKLINLPEEMKYDAEFGK